MMDAIEAKTLTNRNLKEPTIENHCHRINFKIRKAAEEGESSIRNPHDSNGTMLYVTKEERKIVELYYENKGYTWTSHENPDPGHPCSSAYTTLDW